MTTERNESTCPGPNGNGCDCKAEGKDPLCPWWPLHPEDVADESPAATASPRYVLADRWSSTNHQYGWVVWDTQEDRKASGWHRDQHYLAPYCHSLNGVRTLREQRLSECYECGRPFPHPVPEQQAREEWGDAADDEIAYNCGACADPELVDG